MRRRSRRIDTPPRLGYRLGILPAGFPPQMPIGVLLGLVSFSIYAVGDAITKGFAGHVGVFELQFFINLFALVPAPLAKAKDERWRDIFKLGNPLLMNGRAFLYTAATLCFTHAVTNIPFAET